MVSPASIRPFSAPASSLAPLSGVPGGQQLAATSTGGNPTGGGSAQPDTSQMLSSILQIFMLMMQAMLQLLGGGSGGANELSAGMGSHSSGSPLASSGGQSNAASGSLNASPSGGASGGSPAGSGGPTNLLVEGDSLSDTHAAGNFVWAGQVADKLKGQGVQTTNLAHVGDTLAAMKQQAASAPAAQPGKNNVVVLFGGTNDLFQGTSTGEAVNRLKDVASAYKQKGYKVVVLTLPQGGKVQNQGFNDALRNGSGPWDGVIDINQTRLAFGGDGVHIDGSSHQRVAQLVESQIGRFL